MFPPPILQRGDLARCPRCKAVIARFHNTNVDRGLALAVSGAILLAVVNSTPILSAELSGMQTHTNLWMAALALHSAWITTAACILLITTLFIPALQVCLLLWALLFLKVKRRAPGAAAVLVLLHRIKPWGMVEIVFLGTLVVIVKLADWVSITPGPGLWSLGALTVLLAVLRSLDSQCWWTVLERGV